MLTSYITDNPTGYLSETAFYDAANFILKTKVFLCIEMV